MADETTTTHTHPLYKTWKADEDRMRATYHALRRLMVPYLVPHRFEGKESIKPKDLRRSRYGYAPKLNAQYVGELSGHVRGATARYVWGELEAMDEAEARRREEAGEETITTRPAGGRAQTLWDDVDLKGTPWRKFFGNKVLEWGLSSVGGFVLCDVPDIPGRLTQSEEQRFGRRPFGTFVPMSQVVDLGTGGYGFGFRWIEIREESDTRGPVGREQSDEPTETRILYELLEDGRTQATRRDADGSVLGEPVDLGRIEDMHGFAVLPLVPVFYGEHPEVPFIGEGLILGLDDIVVNLYNRLSETSEGYRDGAFTAHAYQGKDYEKVLSAMQKGARLFDLGEEGQLQRLDSGLAEIDGGLRLIELDLQSWAVGAKRKAAEAMERATARSGVSLKAEYQLDAKPLLTEIAEWLDQVETNVMWVMAQMSGLTPEQARDIAVERDTSFQMEDEATRISRIVNEFAISMPIPAALTEAIVMRWAEASDLIDLDAEVEGPDGRAQTMRERLRTETATLAEAKQRMQSERGDLFAGFGSGLPPEDEETEDAELPDAA